MIKSIIRLVVAVTGHVDFEVGPLPAHLHLLEHDVEDSLYLLDKSELGHLLVLEVSTAAEEVHELRQKHCIVSIFLVHFIQYGHL
jgi:hypothetical protein